MQFVSARDVREGMCVAQDVCDPQGRTLIARGQRIGSHHLIRMRKFGIASIFIDPNNGESVKKPDRSELRDQCVKVLGESFGQLSKEMAAKKVTLDAEAIQEAIESLVSALMKSKNPLVTLLDVSTSSDRLLQHSVNVSVLAIVLANALYVPEALIKDLAAGMLFHDIGLIFLPESLTQRQGPLTAPEVQALRQHAQLGMDHLSRTDAVSSVAANVVFRHHEWLDGSGYPQGIGGDKLSLLMKIAAVVEVYDSLTSARFGLPPVLPDAAISFIIAHTGKLFAKEVVIKLCQHIALYPVGSAVQLNSGEMGIVAGVLATAPTRPVVLIHVDNKGKPLKTPLVVDLTCDGGRSVMRSAPNFEMLSKSREPIAPQRPIEPILASLG